MNATMTKEMTRYKAMQELNCILDRCDLFTFTDIEKHELTTVDSTRHGMSGDIHVYAEKYFADDRKLRFCYHEICLKRNNQGLCIWKAYLYFYDSKEALLLDLQESDYRTYKRMDKEDLALNPFIHLNHKLA